MYKIIYNNDDPIYFYYILTCVPCVVLLSLELSISSKNVSDVVVDDPEGCEFPIKSLQCQA